MQYTKPILISLVFYLTGSIGLVFAQTIPPDIVNPDSITLSYCSDSIRIAENISIENLQIDEDDEGMKISIANYVPNEDLLVWKEHNQFSYNWDEAKGQLEIVGIGTDKEYEDAISDVYYKNIAEVPTLGVRSFSITLLDADYLPKTDHFYRYISQRGITWTAARDKAAAMEYYGLQGYLATITSKEENDFIWTKIEGVGWIGANDSLTEGRWTWVTGPEAGTHFWQGTHWSGYKVNRRYSNWNTGEPNNVVKTWGDDEDYAHINADPTSVQKSWNDLSNEGDKDMPTGYYFPQGFIVEFGGLENTKLNLSATATIEVSKIAFSDKREYYICEGESLELNVNAEDVYDYSWSPVDNMLNLNSSNPVVRPTSETIYRAIGKLGTCIDTAYFKVSVNTLPESLLDEDGEEVVCAGDSVVLSPGIHETYLWSNDSTSSEITVVEAGKYWVELTDSLGCATIDTVEVKWSVKPIMDTAKLESLVCGSKTKTIKIAFIQGSANTTLKALDPAKVTVSDPTSLNPKVEVSEYGAYLFELEMEDPYGCSFQDTLMMEFHNQPKAQFDLDEEKCQGYNLELVFIGTTVEESEFTWYYNDDVFRSEVGLDSIIIPLGYGESSRSVGLKVNEQGCIDSLAESVTVIPAMNFWVKENNEGCSPLNVKFGNKDIEKIKSYLWDFGDGETTTSQQPEHAYVNSCTDDLSFDVSLTVVSTEDCMNTGTLYDTVVVHPIPTVDFSFNEADCNDAEMEIWYTGSAKGSDTFKWNLDVFLPDEILVNPGLNKGPLKINRYSSPTAEIGLQVVSQYGCRADYFSKNWKRKPLFEVKVDTTEGCPPLVVSAKAVLLDSVDVVSFYYDLGDGTTGNGDMTEHIFSVPETKYILLFTANSSLTGCSDTMVHAEAIETYPVPDANFTPIPEVVLISEPDISFENQSVGATEYEWDFGNSSPLSDEKNPVHVYSQMGFYTVLLEAYNYRGCSDTISHQVAVAFDQLFPPNAFSPNATLEEDREFRIYSEGVADEGYQLLIFNRWGEEIFESRSQTVGWTGKMLNGNYAPAGVYAWVLQYKDFRGKIHKQKGSVTLLF